MLQGHAQVVLAGDRGHVQAAPQLCGPGIRGNAPAGGPVAAVGTRHRHGEPGGTVWWPVGDGRGTGPAPPVSARRPASAPARLPPTRTRVTRLVRGDPTSLTYPGSGPSERFLTQSRHTGVAECAGPPTRATRKPGRNTRFLRSAGCPLRSPSSTSAGSPIPMPRCAARRPRRSAEPRARRSGSSRSWVTASRRRWSTTPSPPPVGLRPADRAQGVRIPHRRRPQPGLRRRRQPAARPRVDRG